MNQQNNSELNCGAQANHHYDEVPGKETVAD